MFINRCLTSRVTLTPAAPELLAAQRKEFFRFGFRFVLSDSAHRYQLTDGRIDEIDADPGRCSNRCRLCLALCRGRAKCSSSLDPGGMYNNNNQYQHNGGPGWRPYNGDGNGSYYSLIIRVVVAVETATGRETGSKTVTMVASHLGYMTRSIHSLRLWRI